MQRVRPSRSLRLCARRVTLKESKYFRRKNISLERQVWIMPSDDGSASGGDRSSSSSMRLHCVISRAKQACGKNHLPGGHSNDHHIFDRAILDAQASRTVM